MDPTDIQITERVSHKKGSARVVYAPSAFAILSGDAPHGMLQRFRAVEHAKRQRDNEESAFDPLAALTTYDTSDQWDETSSCDSDVEDGFAGAHPPLPMPSMKNVHSSDTPSFSGIQPTTRMSMPFGPYLDSDSPPIHGPSSAPAHAITHASFSYPLSHIQGLYRHDSDTSIPRDSHPSLSSHHHGVSPATFTYVPADGESSPYITAGDGDCSDRSSKRYRLPPVTASPLSLHPQLQHGDAPSQYQLSSTYGGSTTSFNPCFGGTEAPVPLTNLTGDVVQANEGSSHDNPPTSTPPPLSLLPAHPRLDGTTAPATVGSLTRWWPTATLATRQQPSSTSSATADVLTDDGMPPVLPLSSRTGSAYTHPGEVVIPCLNRREAALSGPPYHISSGSGPHVPISPVSHHTQLSLSRESTAVVHKQAQPSLSRESTAATHKYTQRGLSLAIFSPDFAASTPNVSVTVTPMLDCTSPRHSHASIASHALTADNAHTNDREKGKRGFHNPPSFRASATDVTDKTAVEKPQYLRSQSALPLHRPQSAMGDSCDTDGHLDCDPRSASADGCDLPSGTAAAHTQAKNMDKYPCERAMEDAGESTVAWGGDTVVDVHESICGSAESAYSLSQSQNIHDDNHGITVPIPMFRSHSRRSSNISGAGSSKMGGLVSSLTIRSSPSSVIVPTPRKGSFSFSTGVGGVRTHTSSISSGAGDTPYTSTRNTFHAHAHAHPHSQTLMPPLSMHVTAVDGTTSASASIQAQSTALTHIPLPRHASHHGATDSNSTLTHGTASPFSPCSPPLFPAADAQHLSATGTRARRSLSSQHHITPFYSPDRITLHDKPPRPQRTLSHAASQNNLHAHAQDSSPLLSPCDRPASPVRVPLSVAAQPVVTASTVHGLNHTYPHAHVMGVASRDDVVGTHSHSFDLAADSDAYTACTMSSASVSPPFKAETDPGQAEAKVDVNQHGYPQGYYDDRHITSSASHHHMRSNSAHSAAYGSTTGDASVPPPSPTCALRHTATHTHSQAESSPAYAGFPMPAFVTNAEKPFVGVFRDGDSLDDVPIAFGVSVPRTGGTNGLDSSGCQSSSSHSVTDVLLEDIMSPSPISMAAAKTDYSCSMHTSPVSVSPGFPTVNLRRARAPLDDSDDDDDDDIGNNEMEGTHSHFGSLNERSLSRLPSPSLSIASSDLDLAAALGSVCICEACELSRVYDPKGRHSPAVSDVRDLSRVKESVTTPDGRVVYHTCRLAIAASLHCLREMDVIAKNEGCAPPTPLPMINMGMGMGGDACTTTTTATAPHDISAPESSSRDSSAPTATTTTTTTTMASSAAAASDGCMGPPPPRTAPLRNHHSHPFPHSTHPYAGSSYNTSAAFNTPASYYAGGSTYVAPRGSAGVGMSFGTGLSRVMSTRSSGAWKGSYNSYTASTSPSLCAVPSTHSQTTSTPSIPSTATSTSTSSTSLSGAPVPTPSEAGNAASAMGDSHDLSVAAVEAEVVEEDAGQMDMHLRVSPNTCYAALPPLSPSSPRSSRTSTDHNKYMLAGNGHDTASSQSMPYTHHPYGGKFDGSSGTGGGSFSMVGPNSAFTGNSDSNTRKGQRPHRGSLPAIHSHPSHSSSAPPSNLHTSGIAYRQSSRASSSSPPLAGTTTTLPPPFPVLSPTSSTTSLHSHHHHSPTQLQYSHSSSSFSQRSSYNPNACLYTEAPTIPLLHATATNNNYNETLHTRTNTASHTSTHATNNTSTNAMPTFPPASSIFPPASPSQPFSTALDINGPGPLGRGNLPSGRAHSDVHLAHTDHESTADNCMRVCEAGCQTHIDHQQTPSKCGQDDAHRHSLKRVRSEEDVAVYEGTEEVEEEKEVRRRTKGGAHAAGASREQEPEKDDSSRAAATKTDAAMYPSTVGTSMHACKIGRHGVEQPREVKEARIVCLASPVLDADNSTHTCGSANTNTPTNTSADVGVQGTTTHSNAVQLTTAAGSTATTRLGASPDVSSAMSHTPTPSNTTTHHQAPPQTLSLMHPRACAKPIPFYNGNSCRSCGRWHTRLGGNGSSVPSHGIHTKSSKRGKDEDSFMSLSAFLPDMHVLARALAPDPFLSSSTSQKSMQHSRQSHRRSSSASASSSSVGPGHVGGSLCSHVQHPPPAHGTGCHDLLADGGLRYSYLPLEVEFAGVHDPLYSRIGGCDGQDEPSDVDEDKLTEASAAGLPTTSDTSADAYNAEEAYGSLPDDHNDVDTPIGMGICMRCGMCCNHICVLGSPDDFNTPKKDSEIDSLGNILSSTSFLSNTTVLSHECLNILDSIAASWADNVSDTCTPAITAPTTINGTDEIVDAYSSQGSQVSAFGSPGGADSGSQGSVHSDVDYHPSFSSQSHTNTCTSSTTSVSTLIPSFSTHNADFQSTFNNSSVTTSLPVTSMSVSISVAAPFTFPEDSQCPVLTYQRLCRATNLFRDPYSYPSTPANTTNTTSSIDSTNTNATTESVSAVAVILDTTTSATTSSASTPSSSSSSCSSRASPPSLGLSLHSAPKLHVPPSGTLISNDSVLASTSISMMSNDAAMLTNTLMTNVPTRTPATHIGRTPATSVDIPPSHQDTRQTDHFGPRERGYGCPRQAINAPVSTKMRKVRAQRPSFASSSAFTSTTDLYSLINIGNSSRNNPNSHFRMSMEENPLLPNPSYLFTTREWRKCGISQGHGWKHTYRHISDRASLMFERTDL